MSDNYEAAVGDLTAASAGQGVVRVFKRLRAGKTETVRHGLGTLPVVDVYRLDYFPVVSTADEVTDRTWVNFYLYHTSDRSVRLPPGGGRVTLDPRDAPEGKLPLEPLLAQYGVQYSDETHLGDVVNEFWKALFSDPSDAFDETAYADSPWLARCCGDRRSVGDLRKGGDWNDLWLRFRPRKTLNFPRVGPAMGQELFDGLIALVNGNAERARHLFELARQASGRGGLGAPPQVEVTHVDFETLALRLLPPFEGLYAGSEEIGEPGVPEEAPILRDELNVMLLLRA